LIEDRNPDTVAEISLLRVRADLRLGRHEDALHELHRAEPLLTGYEESLTARMLSGVAYLRAGEIGRGLDILNDAQRDAANAHLTIRSEIALNRALVYFIRRDLETAERLLLDVDASSDIVYAKALEYHAWIASARADYAHAAECFLATLHFLDQCRHYDRFLESNCLQALATLAVERLEPETWQIVARRRQAIDWSASDLGRHRFWIALCAATYAYEVEGSPVDAIREGRLAKRIAPTSAARVEALCRLAATSGRAKERLGQLYHTEEAYDLFATLDASTFEDYDKLVPLVLAKELALSGRPEQAHKVYKIYKQHSLTSPLLAVTGDPRRYAFERLVEGNMAESDDEKVPAQRAYLDAFATFRRIDYKRRAVHAALRLGWVLNDSNLFQYADETTRHLPAQSWLRRQVERLPTDLVLRSLKPTQRDVLELLCTGMTTREIAEMRGRHIGTIKNTVTGVFRAFHVRNRIELLNELLRRGLLKSA
jgi:DNA-binding CsgD family transcriptional regulator